jgi:hypothetical protein
MGDSMAIARTRPREERLELRMSREEKLALEVAARHQGVSITDYLLAHSLPPARQEAYRGALAGKPTRDFLVQMLEKMLL